LSRDQRASVPSSRPGADDGKPLPLEELVRQLKVALLQVAESREKLPKLDNAVLEAKTSVKIKAKDQLVRR
jgi:hypothetical protein